MCRTTDFHDSYSLRQNLLRIKAFFVRFSASDSSNHAFPDSLTLVYLPRITQTALLQVSGSKIRPDSSAFVTLHRVVKAAGNREVIYGSRERVRAGDGVRFEVYASEEKVFKGIFRKSEGQNWKLECNCALEIGGGELAAAELSVADVCVAVEEGGAVMAERVEMAAVRRKNRRICFDELEEIPEEREGESCQSDGACCCRCGESNGGDLEGSRDCGDDGEMDMDLEGVKWALDVGVWVMCLGVGFLVSKASAKSLRQLRLL